MASSSVCMSWSRYWSFALVARQRATSVNSQSGMSYWTEMYLMWTSWAMSSRRWSTITHFGESSPPSTLSWDERALSGLRWERRGFTSSETQVPCKMFYFEEKLNKYWFQVRPRRKNFWGRPLLCLYKIEKDLVKTVSWSPADKMKICWPRQQPIYKLCQNQKSFWILSNGDGFLRFVVEKNSEHPSGKCPKIKLFGTRSLGALRASTSRLRPFGPAFWNDQHFFCTYSPQYICLPVRFTLDFAHNFHFQINLLLVLNFHRL